jgi:hypothetical protein
MSSPICRSWRGDRGDVGDVVLRLDVARHVLQRLGDLGDRLVDADLEAHRRRARGDVAQAFLDHRLRENRGGRRAVAGDVVGLGRHFLGELGAHVLVGVLQLDLTGDRHAVVR